MKRTTIALPDELALRVARAAQRKSLSVSELARRALEAYLGLPEKGPRRVPFAALFSGGDAGTSERFDEILAELMERRFTEKVSDARDR